MSIADLDALYAAAVAALDAGDYPTAITKALAVKVRLATMPNVTGRSHSHAWGNAMALDNFISECRKLQTAAIAAAGGPLQSTKVIYVRPPSTDS